MNGRILVAYAGVMGGTAGIAEAIGDELGRRGHQVDVRDVVDVDDVSGYHVVIVGSALYMRHWRRTAVRFLRRYAAELPRKQVWTFHSGPLGPERHAVETTPPNVARLLRRIGAVEPVTFGGRLEPPTAKGVLARRMAKGELAGDFRDWDQIRDWANALHDTIAVAGLSDSSRTEQRR